MITIRTAEYWIKEPIDSVLDKIKWETHLVKFRIFNIYDAKYAQLTKPWLGEIDVRRNLFKLFRVTGRNNTSDISVHGSYIAKSRPLIQVKFKIHFTAFFGLFGLLLFIFCMWFLISKRGIDLPLWSLVISLVIVGFVYSLTIVHDLNISEKMMEELIFRRYRDVELDELADDEE